MASAIEELPADQRWQTLEALFGVERLAELLGTSPASVGRYLAGARKTPDDVAGRPPEEVLERVRHF